RVAHCLWTTVCCPGVWNCLTMAPPAPRRRQTAFGTPASRLNRHDWNCGVPAQGCTCERRIIERLKVRSSAGVRPVPRCGTGKPGRQLPARRKEGTMGQWYFARNRQKYGPFTDDQMKQLAAGGHLQPTDMVLQDGQKQWQPATVVLSLFT